MAMTTATRIHNFSAGPAAMPQASGIALGLDRLVMLCLGATRIEQVLWAPIPEFVEVPA